MKKCHQADGRDNRHRATSMEEITDALLRKATEAGAVGYHITHVDSHKPGNDQQHILEATATLYALDEKALQRA